MSTPSSSSGHCLLFLPRPLFLSLIYIFCAGSTHSSRIRTAGTSHISEPLCLTGTDCSLPQDILFFLFWPWQAFSFHDSEHLPLLTTTPVLLGTISSTFPCKHRAIPFSGQVSLGFFFQPECSPGHFSSLRQGFVLYLSPLPSLQALLCLDIVM